MRERSYNMEKQQHNHNGLGNGFMLGLLVGVVVTLLFTTKKGREVLKTLTERGADEISELKSRLNEVREQVEEDLDDPEETEIDFVEIEERLPDEEEEKPPVKKLIVHHADHEGHEHEAPHHTEKEHEEPKEEPEKKKPRSFFRIKKS